MIKQKDSQSKYTSRLPSGVLSLIVCIHSECEDGEKWPLRQCMQELLNDQCDPNSEDISGEKIIFYVIRNGKK